MPEVLAWRPLLTLEKTGQKVKSVSILWPDFNQLTFSSQPEGLLVRDRGGLLSCCRLIPTKTYSHKPTQSCVIMLMDRRPDSVLLPHPPLQLSILSDALALAKWRRSGFLSKSSFRVFLNPLLSISDNFWWLSSLFTFACRRIVSFAKPQLPVSIGSACPENNPPCSKVNRL